MCIRLCSAIHTALISRLGQRSSCVIISDVWDTRILLGIRSTLTRPRREPYRLRLIERGWEADTTKHLLLDLLGPLHLLLTIRRL